MGLHMPTTQYVPRYDSNDNSMNVGWSFATLWPSQASQSSDCPTGVAPRRTPPRMRLVSECA